AAGKIQPTPKYVDSLTKIYAHFREFALTQANDFMLAKAALNNNVDLANADDMILLLDKNAPQRVYEQMALSGEYEAQVAATNKRNNQIAAMTAKGHFSIRTINN